MLVVMKSLNLAGCNVDHDVIFSKGGLVSKTLVDPKNLAD